MALQVLCHALRSLPKALLQGSVGLSFKALTDPIFDKDTYLQIYEPGNFGHRLARDVALLCGLWIVWNAYLEVYVYILKMNSHDSYV